MFEFLAAVAEFAINFRDQSARRIPFHEETAAMAAAMPEDLNDRLARFDEIAATQKSDGAFAVAIAGLLAGLDGLSSYIKDILRQPTPSQAKQLAIAIKDRSTMLDGDRLAAYLWLAVIGLAEIAASLHPDLADAVGWFVPDPAPTVVVAEQAAS